MKQCKVLSLFLFFLTICSVKAQNIQKIDFDYTKQFNLTAFTLDYNQNEELDDGESHLATEDVSASLFIEHKDYNTAGNRTYIYFELRNSKNNHFSQFKASIEDSDFARIKYDDSTIIYLLNDKLGDKVLAVSVANDTTYLMFYNPSVLKLVKSIDD